MKPILSFLLIVVTLFVQVQSVYTGEPEWDLYGNSKNIHYNQKEHTWTNENVECEMVFRMVANEQGISEARKIFGEKVPEKKSIKIIIRCNLFLNEKTPLQNFQEAVACGFFGLNRRFKLINVEETINRLTGDTTQFRIWPHLGLLYVGTVADQEGWDVSLYDELVDGFVNMETFVQPGDVVGLSLVATGMERGIELARHAKQLGARYVIVGNDSAIFRADQILQLPDHPIDAVFTSNSLTSVRDFFRMIESVPVEDLFIPGIATVPSGITISNEKGFIRAEKEIRAQLVKEKKLDLQDVFIVPKLDLFQESYWNTVWNNYQAVFGHKHNNPSNVRNALGLFAQGCTRTGTDDVCSYCTIAGVTDIRIPKTAYLQNVLEVYSSKGINYVFNVTDSILEMKNVYTELQKIGAFFSEGLMIYGRAWGLAHYPQFIDNWLSLTGGRLLINVGMDSGDESMLSGGIIKASQAGSRLEENRQAIRNVAASGAHLHYSLIFGSPGETRETCERSMEFFEWSRSVLGTQLDQCETDIYWLNHGSPASRVFHDYAYAQKLARIAGKEISKEVWADRFYKHRNTLVVPWECEESWYEFFTSITASQAMEYNNQVSNIMARHEGSAPGRAFKPS